MSKKYPGGLINKTPPTPSGPYENSTAPGVWTLDQQAYWQKQGQWPTAGSVNPDVFIENLFSTYLYTGNDSTQTITNGIDLAGKGGLVWTKSRNNVLDHSLADTNRGAFRLLSNDITSQLPLGITYNSNGFTMGVSGSQNASGYTYASWTFRKQPKFFDVVTYTGNSTIRTIPHNLGSAPGCIIVKATTVSGQWAVYHRSLVAGNIVWLNLTDASTASSNTFTTTAPTATEFSLGSAAGVNDSGVSYVAYLFAHNAGGFGLTGTDNVISCGSFTTDGSGAAGNITLGYESQWVLVKRADGVGSWFIVDTMRGSSLSSYNYISANTANAENAQTSTQGIYPTATGFYVGNNLPAASATYIYIAIRRGPMKTPTTGTSVFSPVTSSAQTGTITSGFPTDLVMELDRTTGTPNFNRMFQDRLRGNFRILGSATSNAETSNTSTASFDSNTGIILNGGGVYVNGFVYEQFRRAPGFFDEVCYTGDGVEGRAVTHNLTVAPELMIIKKRSSSSFSNWTVFCVSLGANFTLQLNTDIAKDSTGIFPTTSQTASTFILSTSLQVNESGATYVAYLFATCPGVSKVGSYTGTGALQTVDCGFAAGARFVLIKRTDSTGDWYVWDSARGISSGNDPYLLLNSTAAEVTGTNYVDTTAVGFQVTAAAPGEINAVGGTFIFLAVS